MEIFNLFEKVLSGRMVAVTYKLIFKCACDSTRTSQAVGSLLFTVNSFINDISFQQRVLNNDCHVFSSFQTQ